MGPRPLPDFILQQDSCLSVEIVPPQLQDEIWEWPGNEATDLMFGLERIIFFFLFFQNSTMADDRPRTHWVPTLNIHSLVEDWRFDRYSIPMELYKSIQ